jgi:CDP-glycerol glycerophosphotransferase (TagB/SpsB family)
MIREGSSWKNKVIYVEGGFVNVDFNAYKKTDISPNDKYISFFTGAQTLHKYSDSFYIKKILNMMQNDKILLVKIHPFENVSDYDYLKSNPNVRLYTYNQISNPELILMSSICISQFSTLTYEAKYFCENAFFINFEWKEDYLYDDLSYVNEYIEIIDSLDFLKKVLYREHATIPIEKYRKNFNMTYPNTFETLESFISNCIKEHIK